MLPPGVKPSGSELMLLGENCFNNLLCVLFLSLRAKLLKKTFQEGEWKTLRKYGNDFKTTKMY